MRRVRSDVSHRIRRQPSIFSVRWFRIALGVGVTLVLALLVGPSVAGWFGGDMPRSLFLLVPWSASEKTASPGIEGTTASRPGPSAPAASPPGSTLGTASATARTPGPAVDGQPAGDGRVAAAGSSAAPPAPGAAAPAKPREVTRPTQPAAAVGAPGDGSSLAAPPAVYWVQVGAFLDHRNADRLAERLRSDGLSAATTSFEQSRVLYRVLLVGADGGRVTDEAVERVKGLGHTVDATPDGPAVTGLVPLRRAVETSHTLR